MLIFQKQTPDNPTYYYRSTAASEKELNQDTVEIWIEILRRIHEHREDGSWDRLIFECWCLDGFVLAYPHKRGESPDMKKPSIVISMDALNDTKQKIDDAEDDGAVNNILILAYIKITGAIKSMYKREPALNAIRKTLEKNDFTCWTMKNADINSLYKFNIIFR